MLLLVWIQPKAKPQGKLRSRTWNKMPLKGHKCHCWGIFLQVTFGYISVKCQIKRLVVTVQVRFQTIFWLLWRRVKLGQVREDCGGQARVTHWEQTPHTQFPKCTWENRPLSVHSPPKTVLCSVSQVLGRPSWTDKPSIISVQDRGGTCDKKGWISYLSPTSQHVAGHSQDLKLCYSFTGEGNPAELCVRVLVSLMCLEWALRSAQSEAAQLKQSQGSIHGEVMFFLSEKGETLYFPACHEAMKQMGLPLAKSQLKISLKQPSLAPNVSSFILQRHLILLLSMPMYFPHFVRDICEIASQGFSVFSQDLWTGSKAENLLLNIYTQSHFDNQPLRRLKYNFCDMGFLSLYYKKSLQTGQYHNRALLPVCLSYAFINLCLWHHNLLLWESCWYHKQGIMTSK